VARDPADAGGARVDVLLVEIEDPPVSRRDAREIAPVVWMMPLGLPVEPEVWRR